MLFHGVTIIVSTISDFWKRDQFDVIKGMVEEAKINWDGFISDVLYSSPMFFKTFSYSETILNQVHSLRDILPKSIHQLILLFWALYFKNSLNLELVQPT